MSSIARRRSDLSDALANYESDEHAVTVIVNAFYEKACRIARSRIPPGFGGRISGRSIANTALRGVFVFMLKRDLANPSAQDFENILRSIIRKKLIGRLRFHSAKRRTVARSVSLSDAPSMAVYDDTLTKCISDELYQLVKNELHALHGFGLRFRLAELGILLFESSTEILRTLEIEYPNEPIPSTRNILQKLEQDRESLRDFLAVKWGLGDD